MDSHTAERIFKQLDASFTFPAQQREEASVPVRYYPDVDKHFLGCYYHEGIFVVSYNRKLLVETAKKQQMYPAQIIPELADLISKKRQEWRDESLHPKRLFRFTGSNE